MSATSIPPAVQEMIDAAAPGWQPVLAKGIAALAAAQPTYLPALLAGEFLPTEARLFAAFKQPIDAVRYVLVGEGPYPRPASATGVCFMDGAVGTLWSATGLSKPVNRATSLRNFMKMLLVADGVLAPERTSGDALMQIAIDAQQDQAGTIQTLPELQANLLANGFLLLNAALVFRTSVPPSQEARAWQPFLETVLAALAEHAVACERVPPTLILWGKIAGQVGAIAASSAFPKAIAEHPYNLSFITNQAMHSLFADMALLRRIPESPVRPGDDHAFTK